LTQNVKAAIISLGSTSSEWTSESMKKYFTQVDELDIRKIDIKISGKEDEILYDGKPLEKYDCIYAKGSFRYAQLLKTLTAVLTGKCYLPISDDAFTIAHDKLLTHLELQKHGIPMPKTYITATVEAAKKILEDVKFPIVMKFPHGTGGKGVMFADSYSAASSLLDALSSLRQPFIIQEYVDTGGTDLRIIVVGDRVVASMKRKAGPLESRANYHSGGTGEKFEPDYMIKKLSVDTARAIKAEICAVDILQSARGPLVIEANISPGLQLITKTTKIDVSDIISKYLFERTCEIKSKATDSSSSRMITAVDDKKIPGRQRTIITELIFRGGNIILPEMLTRNADINPSDTFEVTTEQDSITIKKMKIK
jgi:ribosomal protein S6--L-glutamate ligase